MRSKIYLVSKKSLGICMRSKKIRFKVLGLDACLEPIKGKKKLRLVAWETTNKLL